MRIPHTNNIQFIPLLIKIHIFGHLEDIIISLPLHNAFKRVQKPSYLKEDLATPKQYIKSVIHSIRDVPTLVGGGLLQPPLLPI